MAEWSNPLVAEYMAELYIKSGEFELLLRHAHALAISHNAGTCLMNQFRLALDAGDYAECDRIARESLLYANDHFCRTGKRMVKRVRAAWRFVQPLFV